MLRQKGLDLAFDDLERAYTLMEMSIYMAFGIHTSEELIKKVKTTFEELKSEGFLKNIEEM